MDIESRIDGPLREAMKIEGVPVYFSKHMAAGVILPCPLFSRPGHPVFICRSEEDLFAAIDRHFWKELGIEDPRIRS